MEYLKSEKGYMNTTERKQKIFIIDDNEETRNILNFVFVGEGFIVEEAKDGKEALEKVIKSKPDLILLDGLMPAMSGFEVCRLLRENSKTQDIPIIFFSAMPIEEVKKSGIKVDGYIEKPFLLEDLWKKIDEILKKEKPIDISSKDPS